MVASHSENGPTFPNFLKYYMTPCMQKAHLLPTRFFDIFFPIDAKFSAPLHFFYACRIIPHSTITTSDLRQDVINVLRQKKTKKKLEKVEKR